MLEESVSACAQCSKIRGPSSGYRNEVRRCTAICTGTPYMYICLSEKNVQPRLSGFIPALYFGRPKRALRNHADCLQPLENYLASPKAEIILLRSAKNKLAKGKAVQEWRCSRETVRKYLLIPVFCCTVLLGWADDFFFRMAQFSGG